MGKYQMKPGHSVCEEFVGNSVLTLHLQEKMELENKEIVDLGLQNEQW